MTKIESITNTYTFYTRYMNESDQYTYMARNANYRYTFIPVLKLMHVFRWASHSNVNNPNIFIPSFNIARYFHEK